MAASWKTWNYACGRLPSLRWMKSTKHKKNYLWISINVTWNNNYKPPKSANGWSMVKRNRTVERIPGWWGRENQFQADLSQNLAMKCYVTRPLKNQVWKERVSKTKRTNFSFLSIKYKLHDATLSDLQSPWTLAMTTTSQQTGKGSLKSIHLGLVLLTVSWKFHSLHSWLFSSLDSVGYIKFTLLYYFS